jgi:branched-chain amino acid transport system permease protein
MALVLQLLADGLVRGSNIVLLALGFSIAFSVSGVFHFAHGAIYTLAAYVVYQLFTLLGLNIGVSILAAFAVCMVLGAAIESFVYRPLRRRGTDSLLMLLVSIGVLFIIQALIGLIWGSSSLHFFPAAMAVPSRTVRIGPVVMTYVRVLTFFVCIGIFALVYLYFLRRTRVGVAIRALMSDPRMAKVVGVNQNRIILLSFILASALAVPGSILVGWEEGFVPSSGFILILFSFIAIVCGGIGSIPGTFVGGLMMGVVASLAHWKIGGEWESGVVFVFFLIVIIVKPYGLFGYKVRKAEL